jgi:uncharacterized membrane protein
MQGRAEEINEMTNGPADGQTSDSKKETASGETNTTATETTKTTTTANESRAFWLSITQYIAFTAITLTFVLFIIYGTGGQGFLESLKDADTARGLITFLIAVVTVAIALILTLSSIISSSPDMKDRFAQGKEVLTVLIGVLGTIVGFYYGQAAKPQSAQLNANVINANVSNSNVNNSNRANANASNSNVSRSRGLQIVPTFLADRESKKRGTIIATMRIRDEKASFTYRMKYTPGGIGKTKDSTTLD